MTIQLNVAPPLVREREIMMRLACRLDTKVCLVTQAMLDLRDNWDTGFYENLIALGVDYYRTTAYHSVSNTLYLAGGCLRSISPRARVAKYNLLNAEHVPVFSSLVYYDEKAMQKYKAARIAGFYGIAGNAVGMKDGAAMRAEIHTLIEGMPGIDLSEYIRQFRDIKFKLDKDSLVIDGDVHLVGPYPYEIPENTVILGDLLITDLPVQHYPDSLKVMGDVKVLSTLEI